MVSEGKGPLNALRLLFPGQRFVADGLLAYLKSQDAPPVIPKTELEKKFFVNSYHGDGHIELIDYAKACLAVFQGRKYDQFFAAYVCLLQSSGYGKTRTLMEVASKEQMIYVCARRWQDNGFPSRDMAACTFLNLDPYDWMHAHGNANVDLALRLLAIYITALKPEWDMRNGLGKKQFNGQFSSFWDMSNWLKTLN